MEKHQIKKYLVQNINKEILEAQKIYNSTHGHLQDEDMKQEGKYDTRSIETSYLAGAQKKRIEELKLELQMIEEISFEEKNDIAQIGSLVEIRLNDSARKYFLSPTCGGTMVPLGTNVILVISVFSPIGAAVINLREGDEFELETPQGMRSYKLEKIY